MIHVVIVVSINKLDFYVFSLSLSLSLSLWVALFILFIDLCREKIFQLLLCNRKKKSDLNGQTRYPKIGTIDESSGI